MLCRYAILVFVNNTPESAAKERFIGLLGSAFDDGKFVKLTLGQPMGQPAGQLAGSGENSSGDLCKKMIFRPVIIKGEKMISAVSRFATRDITKNYPVSAAYGLIEAELGASFDGATLLTEDSDIQLQKSGKKHKLTVTPNKKEGAVLEHDRSKSRWVDFDARYLAALGITDSHGKVRERMGDKFRQIERFVDLLASAFKESSLNGAAREIRMCDMASGKGYLTFAAYDFFKNTEKIDVKITGVESRDDMVKLCNQAATECEFFQLDFEQGTIDKYALPPLDILVALHACNTATDDAIFAGTKAGAQIIMVAPCCHKEIRMQIDEAGNDSERDTAGPLRDVLRHGIYAERHAEIATDALRVLLLERAGYMVRVSEFVSSEYTAKNMMIIATKRHKGPAEPTAAEIHAIDHRIAELKDFYGIKSHHLEKLFLGEEGIGEGQGAKVCK